MMLWYDERSSINVLCTEPGVATRTDPSTPPPSLSLTIQGQQPNPNPNPSPSPSLRYKVSKQGVIVLATNVLNVICPDASRIHSSVDRDLPQGVRANTVSHCHAPLKLMFCRCISPV